LCPFNTKPGIEHDEVFVISQMITLHCQISVQSWVVISRETVECYLWT